MDTATSRLISLNAAFPSIGARKGKGSLELSVHTPCVEEKANNTIGKIVRKVPTYNSTYSTRTLLANKKMYLLKRLTHLAQSTKLS